VEASDNPASLVDDWFALYSNLVQKHSIQGISAFSRSSFAKQFAVPGLVVFRATHDSITVGMTLWYMQGAIGYYHLGAYTTLGYQLRASFALFRSALEFFRDKLQWLDLGAAAGVKNTSSSGLARFKRGWSTSTRTAYFCGRILDPTKYRQLTERTNRATTTYFPAYRAGEFT
jgi:hypothetical protein